jgi:hypothetical protein
MGMWSKSAHGDPTAHDRATRKRFLIVLPFLLIGVFWISSYHYRYMVQPIPEFNSLRQITADGMTHDTARPRYGDDRMFEFTDKSGKRFQTEYMDVEKARTIRDALRRGGVTLWVGRWQSAIKSDTIFSIYHMTSGERVLINYSDIAAAKKREQQGAIPVMAISLVLVGGVVVFVYRKEMRRRALLRTGGAGRFSS